MFYTKVYKPCYGIIFIMLLKKIIIFYSTVISYPVCGRVWSWSITTVDSRQASGGAWRGEGLFTVQNDRLRCGVALPPWSKIPMRSGERCVQPTFYPRGKGWWSIQPDNGETMQLRRRRLSAHVYCTTIDGGGARGPEYEI